MTDQSHAAKRWEHSTGCATFDEQSTEPCNCKADAAESCGCPEAGGYLPVHLRGCRYFSATSLELARMTTEELEDAVQEWVDAS